VRKQTERETDRQTNRQKKQEREYIRGIRKKERKTISRNKIREFCNGK
jgi:hypothetical protein